ncbi:MAG: PQQ-dependent sugar dehydrogenase [Chloroflexia bacterium]
MSHRIRSRRAPWLIVLLILTPLLLGAPPQPALAANFPSGFADALVANIPAPTALAFTPDGRLLLASQDGRLFVKHGESAPQVALALPNICAIGERGLLGVAVDPNFAENHHIYLYYTHKVNNTCDTVTNPANRVARFTLEDDDEAEDEAVLIDNIRSSQRGIHNAGNLEFGKDGYLYISVGDGDNPPAAQQLNTLNGKILRIATDGSIPPTNPFQGAGTVPCATTGGTSANQACQEIYARGLRNPSASPWTRTPPKPASSSMMSARTPGRKSISARPGPTTAGPRARLLRQRLDHRLRRTPSGMDQPDLLLRPRHQLHRHHRRRLRAGRHLALPIHRRLPLRRLQLRAHLPAETIRRHLDRDRLCQRTRQQQRGEHALWPLLRHPGPLLHHLPGGRSGPPPRLQPRPELPPTAAVTASPAYGPTPLTVHFDGSESSDPNQGTTLTYLWDFGDGNTTSTTVPTVSHTYTVANTYTATLRVRDNGNLLSNTATVEIGAGNTPPVPAITAPPVGTFYASGRDYTLEGSATDPEDGALAGTQLSWTLLLHHNAHTHPLLGPVSGSTLTFTAPFHEDGAIWIEARLTATDSQGFSTTTSLALLHFTDVPSTSSRPRSGRATRLLRHHPGLRRSRVRGTKPDLPLLRPQRHQPPRPDGRPDRPRHGLERRTGHQPLHRRRRPRPRPLERRRHPRRA